MGFTLTSFTDNSQNFVIANHVLEHSPNPLGVLINWARVLRPGGSMLLTVPIAEFCFDRGRQETTVEHIREDYLGGSQLLNQRNLEHYMEWLAISEPVVLTMEGKKPIMESKSQRRERAKEMCQNNEEIHFIHFQYHPFTVFSNFSALNLIKDLRWQKFVMEAAKQSRYLHVWVEKYNVFQLYLDSIKCLLLK